MIVNSRVYTPATTHIKKEYNCNKLKNNPSFGSLVSGVGKITRKSNKIPPFYEFLYKQRNSIGEEATIAIDAVGKCLIAPLLIIKNPFGKKEDKDARFYSAWKQPVEGLATLGAQFAVIKKAGNFIDELANKGNLKRFDLSKFSKQELNSSVARKVQKELEVFKGRIGFALALVTIPITCTLVSWAFPKLMNEFFPDKNESSGGNEQ